MEMQDSILPVQTQQLIHTFHADQPAFLDDFYLSGGTALALHLGHRESEDLDFFSQQDFDPITLQKKLESLGKLEAVSLEENTLNAYLQGVKLQFLGYPYNLLEEPENWRGIKVSSVIDVACTKLHTISMRGSKKDFIDLFYILKSHPLEQLFAKLSEKYDQVDFNQLHILKSLVYFIDADNQPMPRLAEPVDWLEVKQEITKRTIEFQRRIG